MLKINFDSFFKIFKKKPNNYEICFANPIKRFAAFIIDFVINMFITCLILSLTLGPNIKNSINSFTSNEIVIDNTKLNLIKNNKNDDFIEINDKNKEFFDFKRTKRKPTNQEKQQIMIDVLKKNKGYFYLIFIIPMIYNITFLMTKKQATLGQQIFNLCVIKKDSKKLDIVNIIDRILIFSLSKMPFIIPFTIIIPVLITKEKTTIYDLFSGTRVIEIKNQN